MARTRKDHAASEELGRNLARLHHEAGDPSYPDIARDLDLVYHQRMSAEQVRRYHRGEVDPHDASIEHLAALSGYYRVGISALSPVAFSRLEIAFDLLKRQLRCSSAS
jgi:hypothetical protein